MNFIFRNISQNYEIYHYVLRHRLKQNRISCYVTFVGFLIGKILKMFYLRSLCSQFRKFINTVSHVMFGTIKNVACDYSTLPSSPISELSSSNWWIYWVVSFVSIIFMLITHGIPFYLPTYFLSASSQMLPQQFILN